MKYWQIFLDFCDTLCYNEENLQNPGWRRRVPKGNAFGTIVMPGNSGRKGCDAIAKKRKKAEKEQEKSKNKNIHCRKVEQEHEKTHFEPHCLRHRHAFGALSRRRRVGGTGRHRDQRG
jgi:hypothetical protein